MNPKLLAKALRDEGHRNVPEDKHLVYVNDPEYMKLIEMSGPGEPDKTTGIEHFDQGDNDDSSGSSYGDGNNGTNGDGVAGDGNNGATNGDGGPSTSDEAAAATNDAWDSYNAGQGSGGLSAADAAALAELEAAGRDNPAVDPNDPDQAPTALNDADVNYGALNEASQNALGHGTRGNEGLGMGPDQTAPGVTGENGWTDVGISNAVHNAYTNENSNLSTAKTIGQVLSAIGKAGVPGASALGTAMGLGTSLAGLLGYGNYDTIVGNLSNTNAGGTPAGYTSGPGDDGGWGGEFTSGQGMDEQTGQSAAAPYASTFVKPTGGYTKTAYQASAPIVAALRNGPSGVMTDLDTTPLEGIRRRYYGE